MKKKTFTKTLTLNKTTVSNLTGSEMSQFMGGSDTLAVCFTRYKNECMSNHPDFCIPTRFAC